MIFAEPAQKRSLFAKLLGKAKSQSLDLQIVITPEGQKFSDDGVFFISKADGTLVPHVALTGIIEIEDGCRLKNMSDGEQTLLTWLPPKVDFSTIKFEGQVPGSLPMSDVVTRYSDSIDSLMTRPGNLNAHTLATLSAFQGTFKSGRKVIALVTSEGALYADDGVYLLDEATGKSITPQEMNQAGSVTLTDGRFLSQQDHLVWTKRSQSGTGSKWNPLNWEIPAA